MKTKVTLTLDKQVLDRLRLTAREDCRTVSGYVSMLAKTHFARPEPPESRAPAPTAAGASLPATAALPSSSAAPCPPAV